MNSNADSRTCIHLLETLCRTVLAGVSRPEPVASPSGASRAGGRRHSSKQPPRQRGSGTPRRRRAAEMRVGTQPSPGSPRRGPSPTKDPPPVDRDASKSRPYHERIKTIECNSNTQQSKSPNVRAKQNIADKTNQLATAQADESQSQEKAEERDPSQTTSRQSQT